MIYLSLFLGCRTNPPEGTSVGNPTEMTIVIAQSDEVEIALFSIDFSNIFFETSVGNTEETIIDGVINQSNPTLEVPSGEWKSISFKLQSPINILGSTGSGSQLELSLDLAEFSLVAEDSILFKENAFILELAEPQWLTPTNAEYDPAEDVVIDSGSNQHNALVQEIQHGSSLFYDVDRDRQISAEERAEKAMNQDRDWRESLDGVDGDSPCDDFFECYFTCETPDCVETCASEHLEGEMRAIAQTLITCIESSNCGVLDEECIYDACPSELIAFYEACGYD